MTLTDYVANKTLDFALMMVCLLYTSLRSLDQSLRMAHLNASLKLQDTQRTISLQKENQTLAAQVFDLAQQNFTLGVASLSDVLTASQSLVQAQMSYANALGDYIKACLLYTSRCV